MQTSAARTRTQGRADVGATRKKMYKQKARGPVTSRVAAVSVVAAVLSARRALARLHAEKVRGVRFAKALSGHSKDGGLCVS